MNLIEFHKRHLVKALKLIYFKYLRLEYRLGKFFSKTMQHILANRYIVKPSLSLDIGCGIRGIGTVNTDLHIEKTPHRRRKRIPIRKYDHFVMADAHYLPFKRDSFYSSNLAYVLEHLENPLLALKEMKRVTKQTAIIRLPTPFDFDQSPGHLYTWIPSTFQNLLTKVFKNAKVIMTHEDMIGVCVK